MTLPSPAVRQDPNIPRDQICLGGDGGFEKSVTEAFKMANSKGFLVQCLRCEGRVPATTHQYGCPRCIAGCICQKCHSNIPKCRIHHRELVQRDLKSWPAAPPWVDYISATPTKFESPLVNALKAHDDNLTAIHARDHSFLNARGYMGYTPLHFAAHLGLVSGTSILLSNGALTNIRDDKNFTPLLTAIGLDQPRIVHLILEKGANIYSVGGSRGTTVLHAAAANGFPILISQLLEKGAMVDMPSGRGTPLQLACRIGSVSCASVLLEAGENPNARGEDMLGEPPIICAARTNSIELIDLLVSYGADLDLSAQHAEYTALSVAVSSGFLDIQRKLLEYGADVKTRDKKGATGPFPLLL